MQTPTPAAAWLRLDPGAQMKSAPGYGTRVSASRTCLECRENACDAEAPSVFILSGTSEKG